MPPSAYGDPALASPAPAVTPADVAGPMSPVDAAWLRLDLPANLMMVTGVLWFTEPLDRQRFEDLLRDRLVRRYPRFATRACHTPGSRPRWEPAEVDYGYHLKEVALGDPGDQIALTDLVSRLMSTPLDRDRPPWQLHLVSGFGPGSALVVRLHHSLADGIALARVLLSLSEDDAAVAAAGAQRADGPPAPFAALRRTARQVGVGLAGAATLVRVAALRSDRSGVYGGHLATSKRAVWSQPLDLPEAKALATASGGTVNDVLMGAVSGALRRYALSHGEQPSDLRAFVPVDLRRGAPVPPGLGNLFGLYVLPLPVGVDGPVARVRALKQRVDVMKAGRDAVATYAILGFLGVVPQRVQDLAVRFLATKGSVVMTNLPGPREQVTLAGVPLAGVVPWVPQAARMTVGISVFSYAGQVVVGIASDEGVVPHPEEILAALDDELVELRAALLPAGGH